MRWCVSSVSRAFQYLAAVKLLSFLCTTEAELWVTCRCFLWNPRGARGGAERANKCLESFVIAILSRLMKRSMSPSGGIAIACCCTETIKAQFLRVCQRCLLFQQVAVSCITARKEKVKESRVWHTLTHSSLLSCESQARNVCSYSSCDRSEVSVCVCVWKGQAGGVLCHQWEGSDWWYRDSKDVTFLGSTHIFSVMTLQFHTTTTTTTTVSSSRSRSST